MHQVKKPVINQLRLVKTGYWSRPVQDCKKLVLSGPVQFLTYWDFGGPVSVSVHVPERQKPDWTGLPSTNRSWTLFAMQLVGSVH